MGAVSVLRQVWEKLRQRQVVRTAALYAVAAWGLVQVADILLPVFGDKGAVMRGLVILAFAGFPVAVMLAWVFDVTPQGIEVTGEDGVPVSPSRRPRKWLRTVIAAPILAAVVGVTVWIFTTRVSTETEFVKQARPDELPIVAVLPLENLSGRKELGWAGEGIANLIRDGLAQSKYMAVVSAARTLRLTREAADQDEVFTRALNSGITHVLTGEILRTPQGLTVTTRLTDLLRNVEVGANRQESLDAEELVGVATPVTSLIKQGLGVPGTEKVDVFAADYATRNIAAYEAFVVGMQHFLNYDYASASLMFETAVGKSPDFAMARYRLAHTDAALGDTDAALAEIRMAQQHDARLGDREKQYIDAGESYFARDFADAEKRYRALLASYPYESEARVLLLYVLWQQSRYEEALVEAEALVAQDPGDEVGWSSVAEMNLRLGRFDDAEQAVQKFLDRSPQNPNAHFMLGESHFYRSQFDLAKPAYEKALALDPSFGDAGLRLAHMAVLQDRIPDAIKRLQDMAGSSAVPASFRSTAATDAAHLMRATGRCAEAEKLLADLGPVFEAEKITVAYALSIRARCRLDAGDLSGAMALADESIAASPGRPTRYVLLRGLVETASGDLPAVDRTVQELGRLQPPPAAGDGTDRAAALYLAGVDALRRKDAAAAVKSINAAIAAGGTRYAVYELALAEALMAAGDSRAALAAARTAADRGTPGELRLELEPDRQKAGKLLRRFGG
jgi:tetratricopeptide (TPR) repeat protein/TolB-like protein